VRQLEGVNQIDTETSSHVEHRSPCLCHLERISMDTETSFCVVHRNKFLCCTQKPVSAPSQKEKTVDNIHLLCMGWRVSVFGSGGK
jgi:hypothetical protein